MTGWALDVSNWSGRITPEWAQRRRAEEWNHAIVGTQDAGITQQQLDTFSAAGFTTDAYVFMYARDHGTAAEQVEQAFANIGPRAIGKLWIDMEGAPDTREGEFKNHWQDYGGPEGVLAFIREAAKACEGRAFSGIYTSRAWWRRWTADSHEFAHFPLWLATNDGTPDLAYQAFGGWTTCAIEQYAFDVNVEGVATDWNVIGAPLLPPPPEPVRRTYADGLVDGANLAVDDMIAHAQSLRR